MGREIEIAGEFIYESMREMYSLKSFSEHFKIKILNRYLCAFVPQKHIQFFFVVKVMKKQRLADARRIRNFAHGAVFYKNFAKIPDSRRL